MRTHTMLLSISLIFFGGIHHWGALCMASAKCEKFPVFTPPSLVVRYGHAASVTCSKCEDCSDNKLDLENSVGQKYITSSTVLWNVTSLTEWGTAILCYNKSNQACSTYLHITVYQPPDKVSVRFGHGGRTLLEGSNYTLWCDVQRVAPSEYLIVTFYKGKQVLAKSSNLTMEKKPVNESISLSINASADDDGAQYWCDARLNLKAESPPPVVTSEMLNAIVHYKPRLISPTSKDPTVVTLTEGYRLDLNCSAVGNPAPSYTWTTTARVPPSTSSSDYSIESVTFDHGGQYTCTVRNSMGAVTVKFSVEVKRDYTGTIVAVIAVVVLLVIICAVAIYCIRYRHLRTGHYNLKEALFCRKQHSPVPTSP